VATSWVSGTAPPAGVGDPRQLRALLDALATVEVSTVSDVLGVPHSYAGGEAWTEMLFGEVIPRLPHPWRDEAKRRVWAVLDLPPVTPQLVHGDLAGDNLRYADGVLVGVLDWDLASAWDPAVDAACLAWHGWQNLRAAVDANTYARAVAWYGTFGIEQVAAAIIEGEPARVVDTYVSRAVKWLQAPDPPLRN
jgi:hypothetical protein